ncbi:hypothetical protein SUDANB178_07414 [Streptomyces sp. enrichment culture]
MTCVKSARRPTARLPHCVRYDSDAALVAVVRAVRAGESEVRGDLHRHAAGGGPPGAVPVLRPAAATRLRSGSARQLRRHRPRPPIRAGQAPGRRARTGGPRGCRLPGPRCRDRRAHSDATAPQVQDERPGLVRGDARAATQGAPLTPYPRRERHRAFEELANSDPHLGRRERISDTVQAVRRRPAVPPADDGPDFRHGRSEHRAQPPPSTPHRLPCTSSLGPAGPAFTPATPCDTPEGQSDIRNKKYPHLLHFALPGVSAHPNGQVADTWSHFESRGSFAFAQLKRMLVTLIPARHTSLRAAGTSRTP